jgi:heme/copper-type cytochrome/quinol oxidase subunit 2
VGAVVLLAGWLAARPFLGRGDEVDTARVIVVEVDMGGFHPKVIRAKVGEPITILVKSLDNRFHTDGGGKHQFAIDELGVDVIAPPLGSETATFTVSEPGVYPFYCSICCGGKANPSMWGRLIVEA